MLVLGMGRRRLSKWEVCGRGRLVYYMRFFSFLGVSKKGWGRAMFYLELGLLFFFVLLILYFVVLYDWNRIYLSIYLYEGKAILSITARYLTPSWIIGQKRGTPSS